MHNTPSSFPQGAFQPAISAAHAGHKSCPYNARPQHESVRKAFAHFVPGPVKQKNQVQPETRSVHIPDCILQLLSHHWQYIDRRL